jgi:outer membrane receptor protein involved in Fe transport
MDHTGQPLPGEHTSKVYHFEFGDYRTLGLSHLISYGGNFRHARFDDINQAPGTMSRSEGGAYIQDEILLSEHFRWIVGARLDKFDSLKGVVVSPRTTFMVKPAPGQTFRVSYNRAYVAPAVHYTNNYAYLLYTMDLGWIAPELTGNYYSFPYSYLGNIDLKEQSLNAYEIGYSGMLAKGRLNLGAAIYINDSRGDFYWPQTASYTSQNPPPGWPLPPQVLDDMIAGGEGLPSEFKTANRGNVRNKGLELNADARFNRYIKGYANYSWQAQPESNDFDILKINLPPGHRFNTGMDVDYKRYFGNVSVGYVGSAYWADVLNEFYFGPTGAYTVVNAGAGVRFGEGWKYSAILKVSNLANTLVQNHVMGDIIKRQIAGEFRMRF